MLLILLLLLILPPPPTITVTTTQLLGKHRSNNFKLHSKEVDEDIENFLSEPLQLSPSIQELKIGELLEEIKHLNNNEAPGYDPITAPVLKQLPIRGERFLLAIFNAILLL